MNSDDRRHIQQQFQISSQHEPGKLCTIVFFDILLSLIICVLTDGFDKMMFTKKADLKRLVSFFAKCQISGIEELSDVRNTLSLPPSSLNRRF